MVTNSVCITVIVFVFRNVCCVSVISDSQILGLLLRDPAVWQHDIAGDAFEIQCKMC